jgi:menaquinone-dependent protoporphyrinogen IX oxidase
MKVAYYHDSKFGNGVAVAGQFAAAMAARGIPVDVSHVRDADPAHLPPADLYVFSAPGRMGKPRGAARRFLRKVQLPGGTPYALLTTEGAPRPDKKTGELPTAESMARWQRVRPVMTELLDAKGLRKVAEDTVHVTGMKGPLEDGWRDKVDAFADRVASVSGLQRG